MKYLEDCSNLISNIIQLPQDFYRSILLSWSAKSQSKLTEFWNNENSTVSLALNEIYEKYYYNFVHYKSYSEYKSEFQRVNTTDYFTIEWIKRSDKKMSISLSNNKMVISGDFINIDHKTNSKSIQIKELIEMTLLSTGVLEPVQQLAADFLSSRKLNIKVKIPFSHFTIKHDIETLFKKEIRSISTKLPYFSLINLSTRIVASYPTGTILLDDVRDQLMKEFPDDHLSLSIYLTNNPINEFSFVETNDRKYGIIHGLKDLDSNKINELLSYFVLKILNIIPNKLLYIKAAQINIDLNISKNYLGNELSNFKKREVDAKRYIMLYQLAATGWIKDKYLTADILNKAEQKSYK